MYACHTSNSCNCSAYYCSYICLITWSLKIIRSQRLMVRAVKQRPFFSSSHILSIVVSVCVCVYKSVTSMNCVKACAHLQWCQWQRGPHVLVQRRLKTNWKLLIWPSPPFRVGLEQNIYWVRMLCFSSHSLLCSSLCLSQTPSCPSSFPVRQ